MSQPDLVELKEQQYKDPRAKEDFARFHERTRTREPDFIYEVVRIVMSLIGWVFFRVRGYHPERVPADVARVLLQVLAEPPSDLPIPGGQTTFGQLEAAQAAGDLASLRAHGRRVARITPEQLEALE